MITKADLSAVHEYEKTPGRVLSIYLDVDQSKQVNLNRGFEAALETRLRDIERRLEEESERREFSAASSFARDFVGKYQPGARSLVVFAKANGSLWAREMNPGITPEIRWEQKAHLQPVLEALDEFEPYVVVVADKSGARIFTVTLRQIEEHAQLCASGEVTHTKTTGLDHLYSQSHFQRKADEHVHSYVRRLVHDLERVVRSKPVHRLMLAGSNEIMGEIHRSLPKPLRHKFVGSVVLPADAPDVEVLEATTSIGQRVEREAENSKVEILITSAAKQVRATTGLKPTIDALNQGRAHEFVYAEGFSARGARCDACDAIFPARFLNCEYCDKALQALDDVIQSAIEKALATGARIEQIRGAAAQRLLGAGGVGAFLRF